METIDLKVILSKHNKAAKTIIEYGVIHLDYCMEEKNLKILYKKYGILL